MGHWISWSIYTHHHSDVSYTSGCHELFQTLFVWGTYTASNSVPAWTRVWPYETKFGGKLATQDITGTKSLLDYGINLG